MSTQSQQSPNDIATFIVLGTLVLLIFLI